MEFRACEVTDGRSGSVRKGSTEDRQWCQSWDSCEGAPSAVLGWCPKSKAQGYEGALGLGKISSPGLRWFRSQDEQPSTEHRNLWGWPGGTGWFWRLCQKACYYLSQIYYPNSAVFAWEHFKGTMGSLTQGTENHWWITMWRRLVLLLTAWPL